MKLFRKIKRILFGVQEIIWLFVHEVEDWLYPYCDRPVEHLFDDYDEDATDEINFLKIQIESANERIQRLQHEMLHVQSTVNTLTDKRKITIKTANESK
tara:strand:- start:203 stop:499 length:297 start_codon:yes stop_codon:yes gene_type:complete